MEHKNKHLMTNRFLLKKEFEEWIQDTWNENPSRRGFYRTNTFTHAPWASRSI
jgi:hypothetical protein